MSLRLILIRHAKSSWGSPALDDHDRPLNDRGRLAATAIAGWLADRGHVPDRVLSSDARRTRETWALMAPLLGPDIPVDWLGDLYLAGPGTMLAALRRAGPAGTVAMLGHNPGIAHFAGALLQTAPAHPRFADYPTCATLVADFAADRWGGTLPGSGTVVDFVVRRDIMD